MKHIVLLMALAVPAVAAERKPNIVLILADDLGFGELGCYGQKKIRTPNIDRLAKEGVRFTRAYAGSSVCAPSRSCLMTGLHTGHTPIRLNGGGFALADADVTTAEVLKGAGYTAGGFGKWGLGVEGSPGHPCKQGFDHFFGYLHQVHAHFYYPFWLWDDDRKHPLPANEGKKRGRYAHDEIHARALDFIRKNRDRPFFAYLPYTLPHVELVVPDDSMKPYRGLWKETPLPDPRPGYIGADEPYAAFAGMVSRLDRDVGAVLDLLKELDLEKDTVVLFSSDNGAQGQNWQRVSDFFGGTGELRGYKGSFYEGGLRVPLIVRWPGQVAAGTTSDHVCAFWDMLPTLAEIAGTKPPPGLDGISFVPVLLGKEGQKGHELLYWEYPYPRGLMQAARVGDWKLVQAGPGKPFELYDLKADPGEKNDLAAKHPDVVKKIEGLMAKARTEARKPGPAPSVSIKDYVR